MGSPTGTVAVACRRIPASSAPAEHPRGPPRPPWASASGAQGSVMPAPPVTDDPSRHVRELGGGYQLPRRRDRRHHRSRTFTRGLRSLRRTCALWPLRCWGPGGRPGPRTAPARQLRFSAHARRVPGTWPWGSVSRKVLFYMSLRGGPDYRSSSPGEWELREISRTGGAKTTLFL